MGQSPSRGKSLFSDNFFTDMFKKQDTTHNIVHHEPVPEHASQPTLILTPEPMEEEEGLNLQGLQTTVSLPDDSNDEMKFLNEKSGRVYIPSKEVPIAPKVMQTGSGIEDKEEVITAPPVLAISHPSVPSLELPESPKGLAPTSIEKKVSAEKPQEVSISSAIESKRPEMSYEKVIDKQMGVTPSSPSIKLPVTPKGLAESLDQKKSPVNHISNLASIPAEVTQPE
jgi:hypothetical protein